MSTLSYRHWNALLVALALAISNAAATRGQTTPTQLVPFDVHIAFNRSSFQGVNEADALAAFKVFATTMGRKRGYQISTHIRIFDDMNELKSEIERNTQHLVIIDTWEYLTICPCRNMPVEFATVEQDVVVEEYLVLARSDSELAALSDLEGKHVIVLNSTNSNTGWHWMRTELMELGIADPQSFFLRLDVKSKPSQVVLPVFFGKADACVVDRSGFDIMAEMNPQVGKTLKIVAQSEPYLDTIACVRKGGWESERQRMDLIGALGDMETDLAGKQILNLFRFDRLTLFESRHLDTVRALRQRFDALEAEMN